MAAKLRFLQRDRLLSGTLDSLLPADDPARAVWAFAGGLDLSPWTDRIRSAEGQRGAPAFDPRVLLSLWLLGTLDGVASARSLCELCSMHLAYRWICGDDPVNYHTLSDFRRSDPEWLDTLLVDSVASLMEEGLADLSRIAQDGVRVRASAGNSSFRREKTLLECREEAQRHLDALKEQADNGSTPTASDAAKLRAATDRVARTEAALKNLEALQELNAGRRKDKRKDPAQVRASTTDPEARKMKMADGGFRPAYNVQFATTTEGGLVVGVGVTQEGCDNNQLMPMIEKIEASFGEKPGQVLVDGGYCDREQIEEAETKAEVEVISPPHGSAKSAGKGTGKGKDPSAPHAGDEEGMARHRARMGTPEAKATYRLRGQTAEWVNARARNCGMKQFLVRGVRKVLSMSYLYALAHNLTQGLLLRARKASALPV